MIQLSLFPERGFAVLSSWLGFIENCRTGEPVFVKTRRTARRVLDRSIAPTATGAQVVRVERHPPVENCNGLPTYLVLR